MHTRISKNLDSLLFLSLILRFLPCFQKMKGLIRKRSTTAARLQRALSAKNGLNKDESTAREEANTRPEKRQFLMETAVQFTTVSASYKFSSSSLGFSVP
jgi:hypothetical protein